MRGNQEAFILVTIKDGRKFVCAINALKAAKKAVGNADRDIILLDLDKDVLWQ